MAQTEFTGYKGELVWNSITLELVKEVKIVENDGPDAERLDVTVFADSAYTYITDPLGSKGKDKTTITVTCLASTSSYADTQVSKLAFNSKQTLTYDVAKGVTDGTHYSLANAELTQRVTRIPFAGYATFELTFEANELGTWTSP